MLHGYYVIHPMGWDAFGLPAENYAIKMGVHPKKSTAQNVANIKRHDYRKSPLFMTGIWKSTQQTRISISGHSGFL